MIFQVRQYFPLEKVTEGLLHIYQTLLGLQFTQEPEADTWHQDVLLVCPLLCHTHGSDGNFPVSGKSSSYILWILSCYY